LERLNDGSTPFKARVHLIWRHLRHGWTGCVKTHFQVSAGSAAPPQTEVFPQPLKPCPSTTVPIPAFFHSLWSRLPFNNCASKLRFYRLFGRKW